MVIAAPNSAAELAGIIMSSIAETSRHMQSLRNKGLHHRAGASRCCVAVAAVEKRWHYLKEGISLPLYQILEIWYLTTSFFWMALPWPQVSM